MAWCSVKAQGQLYLSPLVEIIEKKEANQEKKQNKGSK
jgi:hypothetical protein